MVAPSMLLSGCEQRDRKAETTSGTVKAPRVYIDVMRLVTTDPFVIHTAGRPRSMTRRGSLKPAPSSAWFNRAAAEQPIHTEVLQPEKDESLATSGQSESLKRSEAAEGQLVDQAERALLGRSERRVAERLARFRETMEARLAEEETRVQNERSAQVRSLAERDAYDLMRTRLRLEAAPLGAEEREKLTERLQRRAQEWNDGIAGINADADRQRQENRRKGEDQVLRAVARLRGRMDTEIASRVTAHRKALHTDAEAAAVLLATGSASLPSQVPDREVASPPLNSCDFLPAVHSAALRHRAALSRIARSDTEWRQQALKDARQFAAQFAAERGWELVKFPSRGATDRTGDCLSAWRQFWAVANAKERRAPRRL